MKTLALLLTLASSLAFGQADICRQGMWCKTWKLSTSSTASLGNGCFVASASSLQLGCSALLGTNINLSAGTNSILAWDLGFIRMGTGSAATPQVYFTGDTNTGLYWAAADTLNITTGGVSRLSIGATGVLTTSGPITMPTNNLFSMGSSSFYERVGGVIATGNNLQWTGVAFASFTAAATAGAGAVQYDTTNATLRVSDTANWLALNQWYGVSGFVPTGIAPAAAVPIIRTRMIVPGRARSMGLTVMVAGTGAGNFSYSIYDVTSATELCTKTVACAAAAQATDTVTCSTAAAALDYVEIRIDSSGCATTPTMNITAAFGG